MSHPLSQQGLDNSPSLSASDLCASGVMTWNRRILMSPRFKCGEGKWARWEEGAFAFQYEKPTPYLPISLMRGSTNASRMSEISVPMTVRMPSNRIMKPAV